MADERTPDPEPDVDETDVMSLGHWIATRACNRDGTDKSYVLRSFEAMRRFAQLARNAVRVEIHD
jgi:hypothetical protein